MFTWIKRLILTITFLALLATNILTLTHAAFNTALSGLIGLSPVDAYGFCTHIVTQYQDDIGQYTLVRLR